MLQLRKMIKMIFMTIAICVFIFYCSPIQKSDKILPTIEKIAENPETIDTLSNTEIKQEPILKYGWIKSKLINVRQEPSTSSKIITQLRRGDRVVLIKGIEEWWHVQIEEVDSGYIYGSLLTENEYFSYEPPLDLKFGMTIDKVRAVLSKNGYSLEKIIGHSSYYILPRISLYNYNKWMSEVYFDENNRLNRVSIDRLNYFKEDSIYTYSEFILLELIKTYGDPQKEKIIDKDDSTRVLLFKAEDNSIVLYEECYTSSSNLDRETFRIVNYVYIFMTIYYCSPVISNSFLKDNNYNFTNERSY